MSKFNYKNLLNKEYKVLHTPDIDSINFEIFTKELRKKLNMSQASFAKAIGVSTNTIEKWEMGINPPSSSAKRLLYLLDLNDGLIDQLYKIK